LVFSAEEFPYFASRAWEQVFSFNFLEPNIQNKISFDLLSILRSIFTVVFLASRPWSHVYRFPFLCFQN
jgi:hypothetical protein